MIHGVSLAIEQGWSLLQVFGYIVLFVALGYILLLLHYNYAFRSPKIWATSGHA